jgi:hypothetical protein
MNEKNYPSYLDSPKPARKQTNYDRIKSMTVEEMAEFFDYIVAYPCYTICKDFNKCTRNNATEPICKNHYIKWLESECEEE